MFRVIWDFLFGCSHNRTTFPFTPVRRAAAHSAPGATRHGTYVVCLDCGTELSYDWKEMRIGEPIRPRESARFERPARTDEGLAAVPVETAWK